MKKFVLIYLLFLMSSFSCSSTRQSQSNQLKGNLSQQEINSPDTVHSIINFETIPDPNAPIRITRKVKQDKDGNLLIAAYNDIIRYNGTSFTNWTKEKGLDTCFAFDVLEDKKGNIWIASDQKGVYCYDGNSFTHFTTNDGLAHRRNMCIYEDKAGNIWIGGGGGASCYDGQSFRSYTTKEGMTHDDVNVIMEDKSGKIWFGTRGNACTYDGIKFTEITNNEDKPFENVWSIIEDRKGNIWIGGGDGVWCYNGISFTNYTKEFVICMYEDLQGNIWTSSPQGVLTRYDERTLFDEKVEAIQVFKSDGPFFGISEDKEGNIWIGGGDGVWRYDGESVNYYKGIQTSD